MACSRWLTSGVSRISCLSLVERNGSDEATKSTSLPGSSMLMATVWSSSDNVGEPATICWNRVRNRLHVGAEERRELGKVLELAARQPFSKNKEALVGHLDHFMDGGQSSNGI